MKDKQTIVEVAMEIALTPEILKGIEDEMGLYAAVRSAMSTSVGGIGPLLRERIIAQKDLGTDVIGVTLLYDRVWLQRWHFWGQFFLEQGDAACYIKPLLKEMDKEITVEMPDGNKINAKVWEARYKKAAVYFIDVPSITNIVYPGPEDAPSGIENPAEWSHNMRIKQSWLLGRGTLVLLKMLGIRPSTIVLSETPTLFAIHDLVIDGLDKDELFRDAKYVFNDHTPLEYAHPVWPYDLLKKLKFKKECYNSLESFKRNPNKIDITQLLINRSEGIYGVSLKHGDVMRNMPTLKTYADKIKTITNGVSKDIWQLPSLREYNKLDDEKLLSIKQKEKERLIDWMWLRFKFSSQWQEDKKGRPIVLWMRRVTEYKRLDILKEIISRDDLRQRFINLGMTILLGGRIHQADMHSDKLVFDLLDLIQKYPETEKLLILLDNFNVWEAPRLYRGIDAAVMISNEGREAAATGFMKAQMNGAMVIATNDGAIPESVFFYNRVIKGVQPNGFLVEYHNGYPTPEGLLGAFSDFHRVYNNVEERLKMIRASLAQSEQVDVKRTAKETLELCGKL